jgi:hypothetical protein
VSGKAQGSTQIGIPLLAELACTTRDCRVNRHALPTFDDPSELVAQDKGLPKPCVPHSRL